MKVVFEMCVSGKADVDSVFLNIVQSEFIILFGQMYCI